MNPQIIQLSQKTEGLYFDRKSCRLSAKDLIKPIIAFANARGGKIAIGIEDDGTIRGFSFKEVEEIKEAYRLYTLQHCRPTPMVTYDILNTNDTTPGNDAIILVSVEPSINEVIASSPDEKVYLRSEDKSNVLTHTEIQALEYDKGQSSFEDKELPEATFSDLDQALIHEYCEQMELTVGHNVEDILKYRGLIIHNHLTVGAILLFGKHPTQFLPSARVRFIRYNGNEQHTGQRINIIKEVNFELSIPRMIQEVSQLIRTQLRDFQILNEHGQFKIVPEYPEFAWFEGMVNALTHRDYRIYGDYIRISMFDDHLEIFSPGKLPNIVTLQNMKNTRFSRNPKIARVLGEFGWVKELNEGVNRIYDEMNQFFLNEPLYSEPNNNSVLLVLKNSILSRHARDTTHLSEIYTEKTWESLSFEEQRILRKIYATSSITTKEASILLERSTVTARKILKSMESKKLIAWHGLHKNDPAQCYKINF